MKAILTWVTDFFPSLKYEQCSLYMNTYICTYTYTHTHTHTGFPGGSDPKESTCSVEDLGSTPGLGRSSGGGHDNPLQYSCLENPHGQRNLVGYSSWGHKESDTTEWLSIYISLDLGFFFLRRIESKGIPSHVHLFKQAVFQPSLKSTGVPQTKVESTGVQSDSLFPPSLKRCNLPKKDCHPYLNLFLWIYMKTNETFSKLGGKLAFGLLKHNFSENKVSSVFWCD